MVDLVLYHRIQVLKNILAKAIAESNDKLADDVRKQLEPLLIQQARGY